MVLVSIIYVIIKIIRNYNAKRIEEEEKVELLVPFVFEAK
jgi:hypothetical protein